MLFQDVIIFLPVSIFFKISSKRWRPSYPSMYSYIEFTDTGANSSLAWFKDYLNERTAVAYVKPLSNENTSHRLNVSFNLR